MAEEISGVRLIQLQGQSTVEEITSLLRNLTPTEKIDLLLVFCDDNRPTKEMGDLIIEKESNIHRIGVINCCEDHIKYTECLNFFVSLVQADLGTKHYIYGDYPSTLTMSFEQAIQLADAMLLNNKNNTIESFHLDCCFLTLEAFQLVWNALLDMRVQEIDLNLYLLDENNNENNNIAVTGLSTNTSITKLYLRRDFHQPTMTNIIDSMKVNSTIEELFIDFSGSVFSEVQDLMRPLKRMLRENITLENVKVYNIAEYPSYLAPIPEDPEDPEHPFADKDTIVYYLTRMNWEWKQFLFMKREERAANAAALIIDNNIANDNVVVAVVAGNKKRKVVAVVDGNNEKEQQDKVNNKKIEEKKKMTKKKKEMVLWLEKTFTKPLMRTELIYQFLIENTNDELIFQFLTDNADICNE